jgi:hypothetical protein
MTAIVIYFHSVADAADFSVEGVHCGTVTTVGDLEVVVEKDFVEDEFRLFCENLRKNEGIREFEVVDG